MTRSARAAALRSTALGDESGAGRRIGRRLRSERAKPKVPLPKPRPIARNVVPKTPSSTAPARRTRQTAAPQHASRAARAAAAAPATRQHAALAAAAASRRRRPRWPQRRRPRRPIPTRWKTSSSCAQAQACGCHAGRRPRYRIRSRTSSPNGSSCAATTTARPSSATALSLAPIRAGPRRPSCAGASRRRYGTTIATTPRSGRGSKTNRRSRPRASSRWRAR